MTTETKKLNLAELCIDVGNGQAIVTKNGNIEFTDCGDVLTLEEMEYIIEEAREFIKYRKKRLIARSEKTEEQDKLD